MIKTMLKDQQVTLFRLEYLEKVLVENVRFLGFVLPLRIQEKFLQNQGTAKPLHPPRIWPNQAELLSAYQKQRLPEHSMMVENAG